MDRREVLRLLGSAPLAPALGMAGWDALGAPVTQGGTRAPDVELLLTASPGEAQVLTGAPTRVWRFSGQVVHGPQSAMETITGSYLGPIIRLRRGQRVRIRFQNQLGEPSIVHWHGLDVPEQSDGHPRLAVESGKEYVYEFEVTNRAGTYWYHLHRR